MDRTEIEMLARYNSERSRGLVHTEEWDEKMSELQMRFDEKPWLEVEEINSAGGITGFARKLRR